MTTSPVVTITEELVAELEALAISIKGWNMPLAFQEPDAFEVENDWEWHVGTADEDGNRYSLMHVNAHQYDSEDSEKLARYYAACNRNFILALLAERAAMQSQIKAGIVTQDNLELARGNLRRLTEIDSNLDRLQLGDCTSRSIGLIAKLTQEKDEILSHYREPQA